MSGGLRIAWTVDDAPTIGPTEAVAADADRMDRIRDTLTRRGVRHCVAFVIGSHAEGHERSLERWLDAGFALGNHTHDHPWASDVGPEAVLRSVERCDAVLAGVGAFDEGRTRWFRFPYLDRGADPAARRRIDRGLGELGYRVAHATIDTFDHRFETPLGRAIRRGDEALEARVRRRYVRGALVSAWAARRTARRAWGRDAPHVAYGHFGLVGERCAGELIDALSARGARWISLEEAQEDPAFADYEADDHRTGLVTAGHATFAERVARRLVQRAATSGWLRQEEAGPILPHLS